MSTCYPLHGVRRLHGRHTDSCGGIAAFRGVDDYDECEGCLPCPTPHCPRCLRAHHPVLCVGCQGQLREDLAEVLALHATRTQLVAIANGYRGDRPGGLPYGGEAMTYLGAVAPWADDADPQHNPAVALFWWEYDMRRALGHPTRLEADLQRAATYLSEHLSEATSRNSLSMASLARDTRALRVHLEDTLHAGLRDDYGAPCVQCGEALTRVCHEGTGLADEWTCKPCHRTLTPAEYWVAVRDQYRRHAPALTATELAEKLGIRPNLVRVWGARGQIAKRGRNMQGQTLYDVKQAEAKAMGEQSA